WEERVEELAEDAAGRSPDHVLAVRHEDDGSRHTLSLPLLHTKRIGLEEVRKRNLDHALDLPTVRTEVRLTECEPQHGRDHEVRNGRGDVVEQAQHLNGGRLEADLLTRLPKRRLRDGGV